MGPDSFVSLLVTLIACFAGAALYPFYKWLEDRRQSALEARRRAAEHHHTFGGWELTSIVFKSDPVNDRMYERSWSRVCSGCGYTEFRKQEWRVHD